jgi:hypothetical protein
MNESMSKYTGPDDWYEWLVQQSRTDHIYDLIHNYLSQDFSPVKGDFVLVAFEDLPQILQTITGAYYNASRRQVLVIEAEKYVVISNDHLTEYLETARQMKVVEDDQSNAYIRLLFTKPENEDSEEDDIEDHSTKIEAHPDDVLKLCWDLIVAGKDKEQALYYALVGEAFLADRQRELAQSGGAISEVIRVSIGFSIVSASYIWNDKVSDAAKCDENYLFKPYLWSHMDATIKGYLELLMIRKNIHYLDFLFGDLEFRKHFIVHYETHMSIVNPNFEWSKMREIVPVLNRINNNKLYK